MLFPASSEIGRLIPRALHSMEAFAFAWTTAEGSPQSSLPSGPTCAGVRCAPEDGARACEILDFLPHNANATII